MQLVYKFQIHKENNKKLFFYFNEQCYYSAKLYNQTLYLIKIGLESKNCENISSLDKKLKSFDAEINFYRKLRKAQVSQQVIKLAQKSYQCYFKSLSSYRKNKSKFHGKPKEPKEIKKLLLIYTNQCSKIKDGNIYLSKNLSIKIPQYEIYKDKIKNYKQIRIVPKGIYYNIEIVYLDNTIINEELIENKYASIDLGINNLCSLFLENEYPELISGKDIKSVNYFYNKSKGKFKSFKNNLYKTKLFKLERFRDNYINDKFHKISRYIIQRLIKLKIGTLVIGYNQGWKDSISMGRKGNQKFAYIPYYKLISMLLYKCNLCGIKVQITEESYTSKCSALDNESIEKHDSYLGKRIYRGLFKLSSGKFINADINGAINILRKCKGDEVIKDILPACLGFLFNPKKIRIL